MHYSLRLLISIDEFAFHILFRWGTKVYIHNWLEPFNDSLHCFCLTRESKLTSQVYSPFIYQNRLEPSGGIHHLHKRNRLLWLCVNSSIIICVLNKSLQLLNLVIGTFQIQYQILPVIVARSPLKPIWPDSLWGVSSKYNNKVDSLDSYSEVVGANFNGSRITKSMLFWQVAFLLYAYLLTAYLLYAF